MGRFISEDPARDPNNPNLYAYCRNNPIINLDPTGTRNEKYFINDAFGNYPEEEEIGGYGPTGSEGSSGSSSEPTWSKYELGTCPEYDLRRLLNFGLPYPETGTDYNWFVHFYDEFIADNESSVSKSVGRIPGDMFGDLFDLGWDLLDALSEEGTDIPLQRQKKINQGFYELNQRINNPYIKFVGFGVSGYKIGKEGEFLNIANTLVTNRLSKYIDTVDPTGTLSSLLVPRTPHYNRDDIILNIAVAYTYDEYTPKDGTLVFGQFSSFFLKGKELRDSYYLMNLEVQIRQSYIIEASFYLGEYYKVPIPFSFTREMRKFREYRISTY